VNTLSGSAVGLAVAAGVAEAFGVAVAELFLDELSSVLDEHAVITNSAVSINSAQNFFKTIAPRAYDFNNHYH
jgi:hypothetical protein